jgi:hypothetical protein
MLQTLLIYTQSMLTFHRFFFHRKKINQTINERESRYHLLTLRLWYDHLSFDINTLLSNASK